MQISALCAQTVRFHSWTHWIFSLSLGFEGKGDDGCKGIFHTLKLDRNVFVLFLRCLYSFNKTWHALPYCLCWTLNWSCTNWYKESLNKIMWYWYRLSYSWWDYYSSLFMPLNTVYECPCHVHQKLILHPITRAFCCSINQWWISVYSAFFPLRFVYSF